MTNDGKRWLSLNTLLYLTIIYQSKQLLSCLYNISAQPSLSLVLMELAIKKQTSIINKISCILFGISNAFYYLYDIKIQRIFVFVHKIER